MSSKSKKKLLVGGYLALALFGLLLGTAAGPRGVEAQKPSKDTVEGLLRRAMDKIVGDPKKSGDSDGGISENMYGRSGDRHPVAYSPMPEPRANADGGVEGAFPVRAKLPKEDPEGGGGQKIIVVKVTEEIGMGLPNYIKRAIADNREATALILDLNTPGGRVDAAEQIRDALLGAPETMKTVAFINPRAASAGAFISLACDYIFIADGGTIGAATPISIANGKAEPVEEKFVSYFRAEMAATARAKGRRGDIAEAMVDSDVEIDGITPVGKLLTLDTAGALKWKLADARANSLDEVLEKLALTNASIVTIELNWAERVTQILTSPVLSGILMSIGMLGILIELYQPGFGLPGIVGVSCLLIFFTGHLLVNLAGWEEVLLFVMGTGLLIVEIYVTPGFGVAGVIGMILIIGSLVLSLSSMSLEVSFNTGILTEGLFRVFLSLIIVAVLFVAVIVALPKTQRYNPLVLHTSLEGTSAGGVEGDNVMEILVAGENGVAETELRPAGIVRFGSRRIDVITEGGFISPGQIVSIVRTEGNRVVVRKEV